MNKYEVGKLYYWLPLPKMPLQYVGEYNDLPGVSIFLDNSVPLNYSIYSEDVTIMDWVIIEWGS